MWRWLYPRFVVIVQLIGCVLFGHRPFVVEIDEWGRNWRLTGDYAPPPVGRSHRAACDRCGRWLDDFGSLLDLDGSPIGLRSPR